MQLSSVHPRPRPRGGYVLLLTLVLLALVSVSLVGLARDSLSTTLAASMAGSELQRRWGLLSLQATLLPEAESLLLRYEVQTKRPQPLFTTTVTLNGAEVTLTFADVSAAVPAGALLAELGPTQADTALRTFLRSAGSTAELRLQPTGGGGGRRPEFLALEQLFPAAAPEELQKLAALISPFGDGAVSVRRAPRSVLLARLGTLLPPSDIDALQKHLAENPKLKLPEALAKLTLTEKTREALDTRLTDSGTTYSLWTTVRTPLRAHYRLAVQRQGKEEENESLPPNVFEW